MNDNLAQVLGRSKHVMFDFDGPVCSVFAGRPAPEVADRLRRLVQASAKLPTDLLAASDPMEYLHAAPALPTALAEQVRQLFRDEELVAIESAEPTPGAHDAIAECHRAGKVVTVVSNNGADAVEEYLHRHDLARYVSFVSARRSPNPELLKPNPHLLLAAIEATGQQPERSVLIGDSVTDIEAAHAAGVAAIGYANKLGKNETFTAAGAEVIVTHMTELSESLIDDTSGY
ncbi:phosphoglycolate phosphatase [Catenulispora sp. MAP12-49]|uniref:HAD family hydrolase n=1 Tax=Catenulispora sp. MAP12-49 TaxID=3156302 RepID=UPI00351294AA